jgi:hypothetical protein
MALYKGRQGIIQKNDADIIQVSNWKIDSSMEILDGTALGDDAKVKVPGLMDWKGSFDTLFDPVVHAAFMNAVIDNSDGDPLTDVVFFIETATPGVGPNFSGDIIVVGFSPSVAVGDLVKATFSFEGSGPITYSAT